MKKDRHIYISLWTNYNEKCFTIDEFSKSFTFHYELIITKSYIKLYFKLFLFTFHYELIITGGNTNETIGKEHLHFTMN